MRHGLAENHLWNTSGSLDVKLMSMSRKRSIQALSLSLGDVSFLGIHLITRDGKSMTLQPGKLLFQEISSLMNRLCLGRRLVLLTHSISLFLQIRSQSQGENSHIVIDFFP